MFQKNPCIRLTGKGGRGQNANEETETEGHPGTEREATSARQEGSHSGDRRGLMLDQMKIGYDQLSCPGL